MGIKCSKKALSSEIVMKFPYISAFWVTKVNKKNSTDGIHFHVFCLIWYTHILLFKQLLMSILLSFWY